VHDTGLLAGAVTSGGGALVTQSAGGSAGVAGEIIIAVSSLADTGIAANDDVSLEGATGAVVCVGLVRCAGDLAVAADCELGAGEGCSGGDEENGLHHDDFLVFSFVV